MPLDLLYQLDVIATMENYIEAVRPPLHIRNQLDIGYKIENRSIIVFEIRPSFRKESIKQELEVAKATYIKKDTTWTIFWFMSDMKWHRYKTDADVKTVEEFLTILEDDKHGCFWG
jgi:hypothetical protein